MNLVVGNEYYWLSEEQYTSLDSEYVSDFKLGPDGFYYAEMSAIDDDEYDYLLENDLAQTTFYSKSTQPGGAL